MVCMESFSHRDAWPLQDQRQGADAGRPQPSRRVETRAGNAQDWAHGKRIKRQGVPKDDKGRLCRGRCLPTARPLASRTTGLRMPLRPHTRRAASAGRASRCPAQASQAPAWNAAKAAKRVRHGIPLTVPASSGSGARNARRKLVAPCINFNTAYWMIILFRSSRNHLSRWLLRKS